MRKSVVLVVAAVAAFAAHAADQPPRWVKADDLRVREGPGVEHKVRGLLQRGAELVLKDVNSANGFCLIEGDGQYGYVACQYLSAEPVARPRAGQGGLPADRRWVTGSAVNLRSAPGREGDVLARLALNSMVQLVRADAAAGYCEVQPLDRAGQPAGAKGFAACQYLGQQPVSGGELMDATDLDPVRAFWRSPSWRSLEARAKALSDKLPEAARYDGPWPRDAELERMKAHLALGLKATAPLPLADWAATKALAASNDPALTGHAASHRAWSSGDKDLQARQQRASNAANQIQHSLGLYGPLHDAISADGGGERVLRLARALELPTVRPSLFKTEADVGPAGEDAQALAGRFAGIVRTVVAPRKPSAQTPEALRGAGLYDMASRTESLTRPVQQVQLYRDGSLESSPNTAAVTTVLWREVDEPECEGWQPGFAFGDADTAIWRYFNFTGGVSPKASNPPRLFAFHTPQPLPRGKAQRGEQVVKLDREATGFVRFTQLAYDLDGDGVPDLLVLEGTGPGPGHIEGPTGTDDTWYRLLLANIGGAWKMLGADTFSYGCGC